MRLYVKKLAAILAFVMLTCLCPVLTANAVPAYPGKITVEEPATGIMVAVKNHGDEFFNYTADVDGYVVVLFDDYFWYVDEINGAYQLGARMTDATQERGDLRVSAEADGLEEKLTALQRELAAQTVQPFSIGPVQLIPDGYDSNTAANDAAKGKFVNLYSLDFEVPEKASSCPLLVLHVQYDNLTAAFSDAAWHKRVFDDGVANYYSVVSGGAFTYTPMHETSGTVDDGVITVTLPIEVPLWAADKADNFGVGNQLMAGLQTGTDGQDYAIYNESSLFAYGMLAAESYLPDLTAYDRNHDGVITPTELAVVVVATANEAAAASNRNGKPMVWAHSWVANNYLLNATKEYATGTTKAVTVKGKQFYKYTMVGEVYSGTAHTGTPSSWSNAVQAEFGTLCHELGHDLGLKDLYDTLYSYTTLNVEYLSLMGRGNWGSATSNDVAGSCPTHLDAFSKDYLGFVSPTKVVADGVYTVNAPESQAGYNVLQIDTDDPEIYYLIENRRLLGYDRGLKAYPLTNLLDGGIVVWRIDHGVISQKWDSNKLNTEEGNYAIMPIFFLDAYYLPFWGGEFNNKYAINAMMLEGANAKLSFSNVSGESMDVLITFNSQDKAPKFVTTTLPDAQVGRTYSATIQVNGTQPIQLSKRNDNLPSTLTYNDGTITGIPAVEGSYTIEMRANNGIYPFVENAFLLTVRPASWILSVTASPAEGGSITGAGAYSPTQQATLQATANPGYHFVRWEAAGATQTYSEENPLTLTLSQDVSLTAVFEAELVVQADPADQTAFEGETAVFGVKASGIGLNYQWKIDRHDGQGWQTVQGANKSAYETSALTLLNDGYLYACTITDKYGKQVTTRSATLHVTKKAVPPQTGDDSQPMLWLALLTLSGAALAGMLLWHKASERKSVKH